MILAVDVSIEHCFITLLPNFAQTKLITLLQKTCSTLYHLYLLIYYTILPLYHGPILRHTRRRLLRFSDVFRERTRTDALCIRRRLHRPKSESANGELLSPALRLKPIAKEFAQMYSSLDSSHHTYSNSTSFPQYIDAQPQIINSIEFTDLTRPQMEDRRRRRSHTTQDKESISNMRIVSTYNKPPLSLGYNYLSLPLQRRRAQNRASQRAFRERKEKHVQHLEHELEELENKHRTLEKSYTDLDSTHAQLKQEVKQLRSELESVKSSREGSIAEPSTQSQFYDPFASDGFFGNGTADVRF